jgi:hypothetical protein
MFLSMIKNSAGMMFDGALCHAGYHSNILKKRNKMENGKIGTVLEMQGWGRGLAPEISPGWRAKGSKIRA